MNRLTLKALAFFVAMSACMGALTTVFLVTQAERLIREQTVGFAGSITQSAREEFSRLPDTSLDTLQLFFENQMGLIQVQRLRLVDNKGHVLASHRYVGGTEGAFRNRRDMPLDPLLNTLLARRPTQATLFMVDGLKGEEKQIQSTPAPSWQSGKNPLKAAGWVTQRGFYVGVLEIEFSLEDAVAMRERARDRFWLAMIVWGMMFTLAQTLLLAKWILFPVKALMEVAGRVAAGEETARAGLVGTDEIADLGRSLNHMADSLHSRKELLSRQNQDLLKKDAAMQTELRLARVVQNELLKGEGVAVRGARCLGRVMQMNEVGGDFFEVLTLPDGGLVAAVGDVSGKGVPAALVMVLVMAEMKDVLRETQSPGEALTRLNQRLFQRLAEEEIAYVTMLLMRFDPARKQLRFARAAHPFPLLLRTDAQGEISVRELKAKGLPLGLDADACYEENHETLLSTDRVLLFTDGVFDVKGQDGRLSEEELKEWVARAGRSAGLGLVDELFAALTEKEKWDRKDDLTLVGLCVE